jgi:hypothetical protein
MLKHVRLTGVEMWDVIVGMATRLAGIFKLEQVNKQPPLPINTIDNTTHQQPSSRQCKSTTLHCINCFPIQFNHHERPIPTKAGYARPSGCQNNGNRSQDDQDRDCCFESQSYSKRINHQAKDPSR